MIHLENVWKGYGSLVLLKGVSWKIKEGRKVGLLGANGAGKTTLLKIIVGLEEPDEGEVTRRGGLSIGYLPQEPEIRDLHISLFDIVRSAREDLIKVEEEMAAVEEQLESCDHGSEEFEGFVARYSSLQAMFQDLGGYSFASRIAKVLRGLGFKEEDWQRPLSELSGGFRMRVSLARLLVMDLDLLLLDEPTNNLDLEALSWLEGYLKEWRKGIIVVTHDRYFLDSVVDEIVELFDGTLSFYAFSYSGYVEEKKRRVEAQWKAYEEQRREIERIQRFIERFRSRKATAPQVQSRIKMLEKMEKIEPPKVQKTFEIKVPGPKRPPKRVLCLKELTVGYGDLAVLKGISATLYRGEGVALMGPNGAGKSSLLKTIVGEIEPKAGEVILGEGVLIGYFAQSTEETLDPDITVFETLEKQVPQWKIGEIRDLLAGFLFRGEDVFKPVRELSGGERSRLALSLLFTLPKNLLLLDEPTNHLDINAREALERALLKFRSRGGALLIVSHDRYFLKKLTGKMWILSHGNLQVFEGSYPEYEEKGEERVRESPHLMLSPKRLAHLELMRRRKMEKERRKLLKQVEREIMGLEKEIESLEGQIGELEKRLGDPSLYKSGDEAREKVVEYEEKKKKLSILLRRWEELEIEAQRIRGELEVLKQDER